MKAIVLYEPDQRITRLIQGLKDENMEISTEQVTPLGPAEIPLRPTWFDSNVLILCVSSASSPLLRLLIELKKKKHFLPVVVIDDHEDFETKTRALDNGADFYIAKPFRTRDLALHVKFLISQREILSEKRKIQAYGLTLDLEARKAIRKGKIVRLRNKEFLLLEFLIINREKILTRNMILDYVWDHNANCVSNTVDVHMNRLRRKIDSGFRQKLIHTIHCVGYQFGIVEM